MKTMTGYVAVIKARPGRTILGSPVYESHPFERLSMAQGFLQVALEGRIKDVAKAYAVKVRAPKDKVITEEMARKFAERRRSNPGLKWHGRQEDLFLKKHKGAMTKMGAKYYEGKIHAHQDSIREEWKRKPRRKK